MKKILLVHAHPEEKSFCTSLKNTAQEYFSHANSQVKESDLYRLNFNPVGGPEDFKTLSNSQYFKYQTEQVHAFENNLFEEQLKEEMEKLLWCDVLIFSFPLWWFGLPAILKGWVDRVFAMGFVYGNGKGVYENGVFKNKTALLTITTGGPEQAYNGGKNGYMKDILFPIQHGMFYFAGMKVIQPFISYGPARKPKEELKEEIKRYQHYLSAIDKHSVLYPNI